MRYNKDVELIILASLLLGSSVGQIVSSFITSHIGFNLFDLNIPGVTSELIKYKTFDLVEFSLSILFTIVIFTINYFITTKNQSQRHDNWNKKYIDITYLLFTFIVFVQSIFVSNSGKVTLIIILLGQIIYLASNFAKFTKPKNQLLLMTNGLLSGFYLMIVSESFTTSTAIPLICLLLTPLAYLLLGDKLEKLLSSPTHLLLSLAIINPLNLAFLSILGLIFIFTNLLTLNRTHPVFINKVYPIVIIACFSYSHLYFSGRFDSVEEGFWLGWLQGMIDNKILYKDIATYHPPLIPWGLYLFTNLTDYSIRNFRLYMHLLEIIGIIFYFVCINKFIKSNLFKLLIIVTGLSITDTLVRNNVEIRLGVGILAVSFLYNYWKSKNSNWILISGLVSAISFFVSLEVGITASIAIISSIVIFSTSERIKCLYKYFLGVVVGSFPIITYLYITNSLTSFLHQSVFYASSFSKGYFNDPLERAVSTSFLHWHLIWQYFSSEAWYWEFTRMVFIGVILSLIMFVFDKFKKTKMVNAIDLTSADKLAISLSIMGITLFRSSLGRSDYHHLLFVLLISIPLFFYLLEKYLINSKILLTSIVIFFVFLFFGRTTQELYLSKKLFEFTTYGKQVGEFQTYSIDRSGIIFGKEVNVEEMNQLIKYLKENVNDDESIYIFPWNPEVYFLSGSKNATSIYTPYSFWNNDFQNKTVSELINNKPKYILTNEGSQFANLSMESLPIIKEYIDMNYTKTAQIHSFKILIPNN